MWICLFSLSPPLDARLQGTGIKGGGKGKDVFAASFESAEQNLQTFLEKNIQILCFVLVKNLPTNLEPVWKVLGERNDRLYEHLVKHFDDPEELHNFLREMAHGTTWPVDCWNEIEQAYPPAYPGPSHTHLRGLQVGSMPFRERSKNVRTMDFGPEFHGTCGTPASSEIQMTQVVDLHPWEPVYLPIYMDG